MLFRFLITSKQFRTCLNDMVVCTSFEISGHYAVSYGSSNSSSGADDGLGTFDPIPQIRINLLIGLYSVKQGQGFCRAPQDW